VTIDYKLCEKFKCPYLSRWHTSISGGSFCKMKVARGLDMRKNEDFECPFKLEILMERQK
jgi:hypothetical protein